MSCSLKEWVESTSLEGVSQIYYADTKWYRLAWGTIFLALMTVTTYMTYMVIVSYVDAPISTSISTKNNATLWTPEIAVCSSQGIDVQKLLDAGLSEKAIRNIYFFFQTALGDADAGPLTHGLNIDISKQTFREIRKEMNSFIEQNNLTDFDGLMNYSLIACKELFHAINPGGTLDGSMDICKRKLKFVPHHNYGPCYVLPRTSQYWPSVTAGWLMLLKVSQLHPLIRDLQFNKGFGLEFGQEYNVQNEELYRIPLNKSVIVALRLTNTKKLEYRKFPREHEQYCKPGWDRYSVNHCNHYCFVKDQYRVCRCANYGMKNILNATFPSCLPDDDDTCAEKMTEYRKCQEEECRPPCDEWSYEARITYSELNVERIMQQPNLTGYAGLTEVRIAYPQLRYTYIEEQDNAGLDTVISNVGGMVGLWVGASIFTVIHVVVFLTGAILQRMKPIVIPGLQKKAEVMQAKSFEKIKPVSNSAVIVKSNKLQLKQ